MQPTRYRPSPTVLTHLLEMSGYLRDLGDRQLDPFLSQGIPIKVQLELANGTVETRVRKELHTIYMETTRDTAERLTRRLSMAHVSLRRLKDAQAKDPSSTEVLTEKREYNFNEVLPGGTKTVTLEEMLDALGTETWGSTPCMNYVGGQLQDHIVELYLLPARPKG